MNKRRNFRKRIEPEVKHRINERIRVPEIRVVDGIEQGIYNTREALKEAQNLGLDLVEIVPNAKPPVCKVIDYGKFLYEEKRKEKEQEKKNRQNRTKVKELKFTPMTGENDVNHKLKKAIEFLDDGDKVKATVQFKGRMIVHKEMGTELLLKFTQDLEEYGVPESMPKLEGRRMSLTIRPKKVKKN